MVNVLIIDAAQGYVIDRGKKDRGYDGRIYRRLCRVARKKAL